jgi:hypothetical protein
VANAIFVAMSNALPGREDDLEEWYGTTHVPEVCAIDGFLSARGFRVAGEAGGPEGFSYLCVYEFEPGADPAEVVARLMETVKAGTLTRTDSMAYDPMPRSFIFDVLP